MALIGKAEGYTKTGGNFFTKLSNMSTYLPIPIVNSALVSFFGTLGTVWDAGGWLLRGKVGSAITAAGAGWARTATNTAVSAGAFLNPVWWANLGVGVVSGRSIGTFAAKGVEAGVDLVGKPLGFKPQVLRSYTAGVGGMAVGTMPATPGRFASQIANERGQNSQEMYNNYMRGEGGVHVNELGSAYGRGA